MAGPSRALLALAAVLSAGVMAGAVIPAASAQPRDPDLTFHVRSAPNRPYLTDRVPKAPGCFTLSRKWVGVKVFLVQRRLGVTDSRERYDQATILAVRAFQSNHGLPVTGRVDLRTWRALHLGKRFCIDRFTVQPTVDADATKRQRIEAMITFARAQLGLPYVWGGAGPVGYDCSGLAFQAMYAGGLVVPTVNTYLHQKADFRSAITIYQTRIKHLPLSERRRGDLVFWGNPGEVTHMAIYLGHDRILEAVRPRIQRASLWHHSLPLKPKVVRPFTRALVAG